MHCLAFSPDGCFLASVGGDDYHTIIVWNWESGEMLCSARGHNAEVMDLQFSPSQAHGKDVAPTVDQACYTLVSCGKKHIKFWYLIRAEDAEDPMLFT